MTIVRLFLLRAWPTARGLVLSLLDIEP